MRFILCNLHRQSDLYHQAVFLCLNLRYSLTKTSLISGDSQKPYSIIPLLPKIKGIIECVANICIPRNERGYEYRNAKRDLQIKKETTQI